MEHRERQGRSKQQYKSSAICGCNGTSYVNPCYAQKAGVLRYRPQIMDEPTDICRPF